MQRHTTCTARGLVLFFAVLGTTLRAADTNAPPATGRIQAANELVDRYHSDISEQVRMSTLRLDAWLGSSEDAEHENKEDNDSVLRVRLSLKLSQAKRIQFSPSVSGHISLPRFQKRVHLFADNLARGVLPGEEEDRIQQNELRAGVRLQLYKHLRSLLSWDAGLKFGPFPQPFTTLTASYKRPLGAWTLELLEQGYWQADDGFGEVTEMDWDYPLRTNVIFRSITAATWAEKTKGVEFEQTARTTWIIEKGRRSLMGSVSAFAYKSGPFAMSNYRLLTSYTTRLHRPWLFLEVAPQMDFPAEDDFEATPSIRLALNAYFGDVD